MLKAPVWSEEHLDAERLVAEGVFRRDRIQEPLEAYLEAFDEYQGSVEDLLELTVDLKELQDRSPQIAAESRLLEVLRYLVGPPVSADDLRVIAEARLTAGTLTNDPDMRTRVISVIRDGLDRRRFPWVTEERKPTEIERRSAVIASAAIIATRRTETERRSQGKTQQERLVADTLTSAGLQRVATRNIPAMHFVPQKGEFCSESMLGKRKADFVVGLWDGRIMPIECKVSNSSTNSVKRLNNDAAAKAEEWIKDFGGLNVVPTAVLSGVYKLHNLQNAQERGMTIFWAHKLSALVDWISSTR